MDLNEELHNFYSNPTGSKTFDDQYQQLKTANDRLAKASNTNAELCQLLKEQQKKIEELQAKVNKLQKANGSDGD